MVVDVQILHIMLFGCHPFLYPSDLELSQGEQVVKLIENVLGGRLQLPEEATGTSVGNLLRRMLHPEPKQRATTVEIFKDEWFQVCLDLESELPKSIFSKSASELTLSCPLTARNGGMYIPSSSISYKPYYYHL
jgi:serine/threonine protein kinase